MTTGWMRPRFNGASMARMLHELDRGVLCFQLGYELRLWLQRPLMSSRRLLPTALYLETSSHCRGGCADCYVPASHRRQYLHLDRTTLERLLVAAEKLPLAYVCLVGGEPLDASAVETNLRLVRDHPRIRFVICTSGEPGIGSELERELGALRNLSLVFSFDGFPATHDGIRSPGSFERAHAALETYSRSSGNLCGASITLRNENWQETTSRAFIERLSAWGCHYLGYAPCESRAAARALSPERHALALGRLVELSTSSPALIFAHPFGQLLGRRVASARRLHTLAVDYAGNVYTARRGASFGNVHDTELTTLLSRPALQAAYREAAASPVDWRSDLVSAV